MTYKKIIEEIVKAKGKRSYRDISTPIDMNPGQVYKILTGKITTGGETLIKLAETVGLEIIIKNISK